MKKSVIIILALIPLLFSCKWIKKDEGTKSEMPETGKVIDQRQVKTAPDMTYSLYIPKSAGKDARFPVIIAFDPHGTGSLPVAMYKDLAEKYGYILMGSNNSRNGLDGNALMGIVQAMVKEAKSELPVDTNRIYTLGFSGGARVAVMAALFPGGIASATGSGAGFPNTGNSDQLRFDYLGMAGTSDFNMHEMIMLDEYLSQSGNHHALILFDGIHEWPPKPVMERSFLWNDFVAMRNKTKNTDQNEINSFIALQDSIIASIRDEKNLIMLDHELKNGIQFLDKVGDQSKYRQQLSDLENSSEYGKAIENQKKLQQKELAEQSALQQNFFTKDTIWWSKRLAELDKRSTGKDREDVMMNKRLKSFLSLLCYMNYTKANEAKEMNASAHAMWIYEKVDPEHAAQTKNGK